MKQQAQQEHKMILFPDTSPNPRAMMVVFHYTLTTTVTMFHSVSFQAVAYLAVVLNGNKGKRC
jgi:hypothetical protein